MWESSGVQTPTKWRCHLPDVAQSIGACDRWSGRPPVHFIAEESSTGILSSIRGLTRRSATRAATGSAGLRSLGLEPLGLAQTAGAQHQIVDMVRTGTTVGDNPGPLLVDFDFPVVVEQRGHHRRPHIVGRVEA